MRKKGKSKELSLEQVSASALGFHKRGVSSVFSELGRQLSLGQAGGFGSRPLFGSGVSVRSIRNDGPTIGLGLQMIHDAMTENFARMIIQDPLPIPIPRPTLSMKVDAWRQNIPRSELDGDGICESPTLTLSPSATISVETDSRRGSM
jgi:hypothetical protein